MSKGIKKSSYINDCWNTIGIWSHEKIKCEQLTEHIHCRNCPVFMEAGHSVFEEAPPSGYLSQWRKNISAKKDHNNSKNHSVLVFRTGHEWFALPANALCEIATERKIHRIPRNINHFISGIVNINGEIKVCYSLNKFLELSHRDIDSIKNDKHKPGRLIVIEMNDIQYVFGVDEVKGLCWYSDSELLPVPATLTSENSRLLLGSINPFNHQVAVFSINKLQEKLEGSVL